MALLTRIRPSAKDEGGPDAFEEMLAVGEEQEAVEQTRARRGLRGLRAREAASEDAATSAPEDDEESAGPKERTFVRRSFADVPPAEATTEDDEDEGPGLTLTNPITWWKERKARHQIEGKFEHYPHLLALKPREKIFFRSDYFEIDSSVAVVLAYFNKESAKDDFAAFWGIDRIPGGLDDGVTAVVLEQVTRLSDAWVDGFIKNSERLEKMDENEPGQRNSKSASRKKEKRSGDFDVVIDEILNGASYLSVHNRLFLKAPDLETLEKTIEKIERLYIDRFGSVEVAPYMAEQRGELTTLFQPNAKKRGKGFHFTSTEFAGSYSLVTNGLNDAEGEYVGYMVGDVNSSAVLMDVNQYDRHVVVADEGINEYLGRQRVSNMWCSKISQAALKRNARVVHIVLDGADLDQLGPKFERLTSRVDLNSGDVNMFEMFGEVEDELAIFPAQMEKLKLMFQQLFVSTDGAVASIIDSALEKTATDFYVENGMWHPNAKDNRHKLRVVNIPHTQVPRLQMFVSYLETERKALVNSSKNDPDQLRAYNVLLGIARNMLSTNGSLFNNFTADVIDGVRDSRRVVYDFSHLMRRGKGVAMAQLVNIVGFAVGKLGKGDTVIIHGTENVDADVKPYLTTQFDHLRERGGRVVYSYNSIEKMLADRDFSKFDAADYTLFGSMLNKDVTEYQRLLHETIPPDLASLVTRKNQSLTFLRRGVTNVVFQLDLALGVNPEREAQRRRIEQEARRAEQAAMEAQLMDGKQTRGARLSSARSDAEQERDAHARDGERVRPSEGRKRQPRVQRTKGRDKKPARSARSTLGEG